MNTEERKEKHAHYMREYYRRKKGGIIGNPGRPANTKEVIWSKVDKRGENDCWPWLGWIGSGGYGRLEIKDKAYYAHRVIFSIVNPGMIDLNAPKGRKDYGYILHTCDNPICCNPNHLYIGTHQDNMRDKKNRGRSPDYSGDKGPKCKLTMDDAREIRRLKKYGIKAKELAEIYEISISAIMTLLRGASYKEI